MTDSPVDKPLLELEGMIGFAGSVPGGLRIHPDKQKMIYSVGCTVVLEDLTTKQQEFLSGHTNSVTCLAISKSGKYIASGQITHMGFKADVIIWDYEARKMYCKLTLHMVKVEALAFSPNDKYLISLGGEDDGSVVVWNIETKEAICGSPAQVKSAGLTYAVCYSRNNDNLFVTGGNGTLRVWQLDLPNRKIWPTDCYMGQIKRVIKCIEMAEDDSFFFCGTTTGDILAINMKSYNFQTIGPEKGKFTLGVTALSLLPTGEFLVGTGNGQVVIVKDMKNKFKKTNKSQTLKGAITSICPRGKGHQFFVGTDQSHIYRFNFAEFTHDLITTCHSAQVNDVAFPYGCSELIATASFNDIRLWEMKTNRELLRITVPNMTCNALEIMRDGFSIISGWDDGRIRAFYPESGKPMYTIEDAHRGGVTALTAFSDCQHIVSGGKEGSVRVWSVNTELIKRGYIQPTELVFSLKEHQAAVTSIKIRSTNRECVSSSTDGTCIIWDLVKRCRSQMIRVNTLFKYVSYHPAEHQILTTGTDRKIGYWETFDASTIRELEGSMSGSINCLDISTDGSYFVSGGDDKLVKVWLYDEGEATHMGIGHSAPITRLKISPSEKFIISVSSDGAILRWKFPYAC